MVDNNLKHNKTFIIIPDSFKGSLTSEEVCSITKNELSQKYPDAKILTYPVADGGEGTVECFLHCMKNGKKIYTQTVDAFGKNVETDYAIFDNSSKVAVIELAKVCGLPQAQERGILNPEITSTYGVGLLIKNAIEKGCTKIILGLGGSSTNDCGCGLAAALGVKFSKNKKHKNSHLEQNSFFVPVGKTLCDVQHIDTNEATKKLHNIEIVAMCDINNPLYGKNGAAFVFAPQKGADKKMVLQLDKNLKKIARIIKKDLKINVQKISGSGAAGGCGAGVVAFLNGKLKNGIETVLQMINFDKLLKTEKNIIVITGEGKLDSQSFQGKVVGSICKHTKNIETIAICGCIGDIPKNWKEKGLSKFFAITPEGMSFNEAKKTAKANLIKCIKNNL
ncbi:MAG: glycerate kinase [Treponema sp.]|nr:glycerate kinase [Treponema sp.]